MNGRSMASRLLVCLLMLGLGNCLWAASGGPDPYGYIWKDSNEPGVTYRWLDIMSRPGAVQVNNLADDNAVGPFSLGWSFHYYWSDYTSLKIGSNGWVSFSNVGNIASCFPRVPAAGGVGDNIVAPFMSDLTFISNDPQHANNGQLWYWTNNIDSFVVQWVNVPFWKQGTPDWIGSNSLELILSGNDSALTFQYQHTDAANLQVVPGCSTNMEIGIENVTGDLGLNYSTGQSLPPSNYAVKYFYPSGANFLVPDITPVWNFDADNAGQFVYSHLPVQLRTNLGNVGNTPVTSNISVTGLVRDLQLVTAWSDTTQTTGLVNGSNVTLPFQDTMRLPQPGQYYFDVATQTDGGQDINPTNNSNSIEIVSVNNNLGRVILSFASNFGPTTSVSWAGGSVSDGVGVKIVPPDFPAIVDSVEVYITGDGDLQTPPPVGYRIQLHALLGNGQPDPNTILQTIVVADSNVREDAWNTVVLNPSVSIASGGFAVAWMQQGSGLGIGAEQFGPISRRSYEVLGGAWSPYRLNESTELFMRVYTGLPLGAPEATNNAAEFTVYPNPAAGAATIRYALARAGALEFKLIDMNGHIVWQSAEAHAEAGIGTVAMDLQGLAAGMYGLQMRQRDKATTQKLIVIGR